MQEINEYELAIERISNFMNWTKEKATLWMNTENPHFGGCTPAALFDRGRGYKVLLFIEGAIESEKLV